MNVDVPSFPIATTESLSSSSSVLANGTVTLAAGPKPAAALPKPKLKARPKTKSKELASNEPSTSFPRIDLLQRKKAIDNRLGPSSGRYWVAVDRYISGRFSRQELERVVTELLVDDAGVRLHNDLFLGILYNAHSCEPPPTKRVAPSTAAAAASKRNSTAAAAAAANTTLYTEKKPKTKKAKVPPPTPPPPPTPSVVSTVATPRKKASDVFNSLFVPPPTMPPIVSLPPPSTPALAHQVMRHGSDLELLQPATSANAICRSQALPGLGQVRARVLRLAREQGLRNVQDSAVPLLVLACELHLKNIIERMVQRCKPQRRREGDAEAPGRPPLNVAHLYDAVRNSRHLLGDELALIGEKINLLLC